MSPRTRVAVIGVGDESRRDDGVGGAVIALLRDRHGERLGPTGIALATCDGDPARLIGLWEGAELAVIVDAAHARPAHPGRVYRLSLDTDALERPPTASSHGPGLGEAIELARVLGRLPAQLVVYAVEAADSTLGTGLSTTVQAVVGPLAARIEDDIVRHRDAAARG